MVCLMTAHPARVPQTGAACAVLGFDQRAKTGVEFRNFRIHFSRKTQGIKYMIEKCNKEMRKRNSGCQILALGRWWDGASPLA